MKSTGTKTGLFLMELVIALLLFALCAAICMSLFATAKQRARESDALSKGVFAATTAAECFKAGGGRLLEEELGAKQFIGAYYIYYDENWNRVDVSPYPLRMTVSATAEVPRSTGAEAYEVSVFVLEDGGTAEITVLDVSTQAREIYSLSVKAVSADA